MSDFQTVDFPSTYEGMKTAYLAMREARDEKQRVIESMTAAHGELMAELDRALEHREPLEKLGRDRQELSELKIINSKLRADYAKATGAINEAMGLLEGGTVDESEILAVLGEGLEVIP